MEIRCTDLSEPEVLALMTLHLKEMHAASPACTDHALDAAGLSEDGVEVYAAWEGNQLLAIGALKIHDGFGELKSMRAHPQARGRGMGKAILSHLIERTRELGLGEVKLETGSTPPFEPAIGLYKSFGFKPCEDFAQYKAGNFNKLYSRKV